MTHSKTVRPGAFANVRTIMRAVAIVALAACSAPPSAAPTPPRSAVARPRVDDGLIRAAGVYWVPYVICDDCKPPVALVAYVTRSAAVARAHARALEGALPLGFPYVVHTDDFNAGSTRGIAVVTGNFESVAAARAALRPGTRVLELGADPYPTVESPRHVTVIDRGGPVPAWSKADVDRVHARLYDSEDPDVETARNTLESQRAWTRRELAALAPACVVQPGDVFVVEDSELEWYELAPVRCGTTLAYVPWTSTTLGHAVIVPDGAGHRLYQVVGAACDAPIIESWRYGPNGRVQPTAEEQIAMQQRGGGGC